MNADSGNLDNSQTSRAVFPAGYVFDSRYTIIETLQQNDQFVVYKALHRLMQREVTITVWADGCAPPEFQDDSQRHDARLADQKYSVGVCDSGMTGDGKYYKVLLFGRSENIQQVDRITSQNRHAARGFRSPIVSRVLAPILLIVSLLLVGFWAARYTEFGAGLFADLVAMRSDDKLSLWAAKWLFSIGKYEAASRVYADLLEKRTLAPLQQMEALVDKGICDKTKADAIAVKDDNRALEVLGRKLESRFLVDHDPETFERVEHQFLRYYDATTGGYTREYYEICYRLAALYGAQRKLEPAVYCLDRARSILERLNQTDTPRFTDITRAEGEALESLKRYREAEPLYMSLLRASDDRRQAYDSRAPWIKRMLEVLEFQHKFDQAKEVLRNELKLEAELTGVFSEPRVLLLCRLAQVLFEDEKYEESEQEYAKAVALLETSKRPVSKTMDAKLWELESSYQRLGRKDSLVAALQKRLRMNEKGSELNKSRYAALLELLAFIEQANPEKSAQYWDRAAEAYDNLHPPDTEGIIRASCNAARLRTFLRSYDRAIPCAKRVLALTEGSSRPELIAQRIEALGQMSHCYTAKGEYREAIAALSVLIPILKRQGKISEPMLAKALADKACNYLALGQTKEAIALATRGAELSMGAGSLLDGQAVSILLMLGDWYKSLGNYTDAEKVLKRALSICQKGGNAVPYKHSVLMALSSVELACGQRELSQDYARQASLSSK
jgi:tetratricopeptide (TPR) repeat protein